MPQRLARTASKILLVSFGLEDGVERGTALLWANNNVVYLDRLGWMLLSVVV
jgi:hypothetical protein